MNTPHHTTKEFQDESLLTLAQFIADRRDEIPFQKRSRIYTALAIALRGGHHQDEANAAAAAAQAYIAAESAQMVLAEVLDN